jgi:fatty-acid desaturase
MDDWLGPIPRYPDKSFEHTFCIKWVMVDTIINHSAKCDSLWRQTICRAGKSSISPYVKFLCAQKMLCYGVSASAFIDYFQMGESKGLGLMHCPLHMIWWTLMTHFLVKLLVTRKNVH